MSLLSEWLCAATFASQRRFNENVATRYLCSDGGYLGVASIKVRPTQGTKAGNHRRQTGHLGPARAQYAHPPWPFSRSLNDDRRWLPHRTLSQALNRQWPKVSVLRVSLKAGH